jgi:hypothetical protein
MGAPPAPYYGAAARDRGIATEIRYIEGWDGRYDPRGKIVLYRSQRCMLIGGNAAADNDALWGGGGERDAEAMRMLREEIAHLLPHRQGAVAPSIAVEEPRVD